MYTPLRYLLAALSLAAVFTTSAFAADDLPEGVEVQARGPVHEAFATPSDPQPAAPPVVPKEPPAAIEEVPPEQKPEGDNVQWVPGYWAWDAGTEEYVWVSG